MAVYGKGWDAAGTNCCGSTAVEWVPVQHGKAGARAVTVPSLYRLYTAAAVGLLLGVLVGDNRSRRLPFQSCAGQAAERDVTPPLVV